MMSQYLNRARLQIHLSSTLLPTRLPSAALHLQKKHKVCLYARLRPYWLGDLGRGSAGAPLRAMGAH